MNPKTLAAVTAAVNYCLRLESESFTRVPPREKIETPPPHWRIFGRKEIMDGRTAVQLRPVRR
jgi:hypothetical protein